MPGSVLNAFLVGHVGERNRVVERNPRVGQQPEEKVIDCLAQQISWKLGRSNKLEIIERSLKLTPLVDQISHLDVIVHREVGDGVRVLPSHVAVLGQDLFQVASVFVEKLGEN